MTTLFSGGRIADLALALILLEAVLLLAYRRRTGRGLPARLLLPNLAAGMALMLGLRAALTGVGWTWIALALAASLIAHVVDLFVRWPG